MKLQVSNAVSLQVNNVVNIQVFNAVVLQVNSAVTLQVFDGNNSLFGEEMTLTELKSEARLDNLIGDARSSEENYTSFFRRYLSLSRTIGEAG